MLAPTNYVCSMQPVGECSLVLAACRDTRTRRPVAGASGAIWGVAARHGEAWHGMACVTTAARHACRLGRQSTAPACT